MKFFIVMLFISISSWAQTSPTHLESVAFPEEGNVRKGDTEIFTFNRFMMVDRISVEIKKGLLCQNGNIRFSFDGVAESFIRYHNSGVTGFRTYILEVGFQAQSIEITNNMNCGIKVRNLKAMPRRGHFPRGYSWNGDSLHLHASEILGPVMYLSDTLFYLEPWVNDQDMVTYISPLKAAIGKTQAILNAHPETSTQVRSAIEDLLQVLRKNRPFFDRLLSIEAIGPMAREILSVQELLQSAIR